MFILYRKWYTELTFIAVSKDRSKLEKLATTDSVIEEIEEII
jgi:hypothetical protein